ncbi:MAG: hypothetical protein E2O62_03620 [Gammaproteobacteria bacterium]|nr:MAG: hypothetical protein E2O62_03620 [Gammaproteobacteria bacterium]
MAASLSSAVTQWRNISVVPEGLACQRSWQRYISFEGKGLWPFTACRAMNADRPTESINATLTEYCH